MAEKIIQKKWQTSEIQAMLCTRVCMVCPQCLLNSHTTALKSVLNKHSTTVNMFNHNKTT